MLGLFRRRAPPLAGAGALAAVTALAALARPAYGAEPAWHGPTYVLIEGEQPDMTISLAGAPKPFCHLPCSVLFEPGLRLELAASVGERKPRGAGWVTVPREPTRWVVGIDRHHLSRALGWALFGSGLFAGLWLIGQTCVDGCTSSRGRQAVRIAAVSGMAATTTLGIYLGTRDVEPSIVAEPLRRQGARAVLSGTF